MSVANWPVGLVSTACYSVVLFEAKLYANSLLQLAFIGAGIVGWRAWRSDRSAQTRLEVSRASPREQALALTASAIATGCVTALLALLTDSPAALPDAAIFVLSLLALGWQALRRIECWWTWIAVDVISIPLYWSRQLPLTAGLYVVFLALCVAGLREWRRRLA